MLELRKSTAEALGQMGPAAKSAIPRLRRCRRGRGRRGTQVAADALGCVGFQAAVSSSVVVTLKDKQIRLMAARALAGIGSSAESAIPALRRLRCGTAPLIESGWWAMRGPRKCVSSAGDRVGHAGCRRGPGAPG